MQNQSLLFFGTDFAFRLSSYCAAFGQPRKRPSLFPPLPHFWPSYNYNQIKSPRITSAVGSIGPFFMFWCFSFSCTRTNFQWIVYICFYLFFVVVVLQLPTFVYAIHLFEYCSQYFIYKGLFVLQI